MNSFKSLHRSLVTALAILILGVSAAAAENTTPQLSSEDLARWRSSFQALKVMNPKWGAQSVEALKASRDAGVPIFFLDVRTPKEWQKGLIKGATRISLTVLPKPENLAKLPKDRNTILGVYCKSGHRSALAVALLHQLGYVNALSMKGGYLAWVKAGYPVTGAAK